MGATALVPYNKKHRPDYNPDKDRHVDHRFIVQSAVKRDMESVPGFDNLKLNRQGRCVVHDEGLAREIQNETRDVAVTRMRHPHRSDRGHVYFFGQTYAMPWAKYDELGRRIHEDKE